MLRRAKSIAASAVDPSRSSVALSTAALPRGEVTSSKSAVAEFLGKLWDARSRSASATPDPPRFGGRESLRRWLVELISINVAMNSAPSLVSLHPIAALQLGINPERRLHAIMRSRLKARALDSFLDRFGRDCLHFLPASVGSGEENCAAPAGWAWAGPFERFVDRSSIKDGCVLQAVRLIR